METITEAQFLGLSLAVSKVMTDSQTETDDHEAEKETSKSDEAGVTNTQCDSSAAAAKNTCDEAKEGTEAQGEANPFIGKVSHVTAAEVVGDKSWITVDAALT